MLAYAHPPSLSYIDRSRLSSFVNFRARELKKNLIAMSSRLIRVSIEISDSHGGAGGTSLIAPDISARYISISLVRGILFPFNSQ